MLGTRRRRGVASAVLLAATALPAVAQRVDQGPPSRPPPDARFDTDELRLPVRDLNLPPGFGVGLASTGTVGPTTMAARTGAGGPAGSGSTATGSPAVLVFVPADPPPPARLPPNARLDVDAIGGFDVDNLTLPSGFGVPVAVPGQAASPGPGATTLPAGTIAAPGGGIVPGGDAATPAAAGGAAVPTAVALTFVPADPPPPARAPVGARFGTSGVSFGEGGVSLGGESGVTFRESAVTGGGGGTSLPAMSVRAEGGGLRFTLGADVLFDFDKSDLRPEAGPILRRLVEQVRAEVPRARYTVEGHTDAKGTDAYNLGLSNRRARSVKDWFVGQGAASSREILTTGLGENRPVAPNARPDGSDDPEGRQRNRRVEVLVTPRP